jgi:Retrotransposon gag protein
MVSKSDFDKAVAEIHSQISDLRIHTDIILQQAADKAERRFAAADERFHMTDAHNQAVLVQAVIQQLQGVQDQILLTIRDEMQSKMAVLESKIDMAVSTNNSKQDTFTHEHTLSTVRTDRVPEKGSSSSEEPEFLKRDTRFQFPRSDCPSFNGENSIEWLRKCTSFFELHHVPVQYRTHLATLQFHDSASEWYDSYLIEHEPPGWEELVRLVNGRFKRVLSKNSLDELKSLHQHGSVEDYWHHFE